MILKEYTTLCTSPNKGMHILCSIEIEIVKESQANTVKNMASCVNLFTGFTLILRLTISCMSSYELTLFAAASHD